MATITSPQLQMEHCTKAAKAEAAAHFLPTGWRLDMDWGLESRHWLQQDNLMVANVRVTDHHGNRVGDEIRAAISDQDLGEHYLAVAVVNDLLDAVKRCVQKLLALEVQS